jgi:hypothetical protein
MATAEDAKNLLIESYGDLNSLKAGGRIGVRYSDEERWRPASFVLMLERPGKVRLRAYRRLGPRLFELVSDGQTCSVFVPSDKTVYHGKRCEVPYDGGGIAICADTLVAALVVVADLDELLSRPALLRRDGELARLVLMEGAEVLSEIWIDPATGLAARQLLVGAGGSTVAEIIYKKHASREEATVPVEIEIHVPDMRASLLLRLDSLRVNPKLPADAFDFSPPANTTIVGVGEPGRATSPR